VPTYEYRCDECGKNFDVVQSFHDDPLTTCPTCGAPVKKVFGNVGIVFKGSGFYKTDSRNGSPAKASEPSGSKDGAADSGSKSPEPSANGSPSSSKEPSSGESSSSGAESTTKKSSTTTSSSSD
jgi:putative FmdB family regulatory protein